MGPGSFDKIVVAITSLKLVRKKALIVSDKTEFGKRIAETVASKISSVGCDTVVFAGAEPNPREKNIYDGVKVYRDHECNFLVSVGGGSSHDCAKGIGILVTNGGEIFDYVGINKVPNRIPPFIAINTTAGSGSEISRGAVITDTKEKSKKVIVDLNIQANVVIEDPNMMISMPPKLTASCGMDVLAHAIGGYTNTDANPYVEVAALEAIKLVGKYLRRAYYNGNDLEARTGMCLANFYAGICILNVGAGLEHCIGHQLGGHYDWPHGVCLAVLLPYVMEFNLPACIDKYAKIAEVLGINTTNISRREAAEAAVKAIWQLARDIEIPEKWGVLGGSEKDIPEMAEAALKDYDYAHSPRHASKEQIEELLRRSFK